MRKAAVLLGRIQRKLYGWLAAPWFFYVIVGLLVLQGLWLALTARYPQAFDENYHFGLIQLHAQQLLPYFTQHPPGAEIYGAVSRDPSYLFHYLFSLPYRLLQYLTDSLAVQVILLRLLNIGLFVWGLFVSRRLLLELGASRRLMHVVLFFFVLTPIMPLLAAHINYDNLIFPLTGLMFLALVRFMKRLGQDGKIAVDQLLLFLLYGLTASIVKYTFTPLLLAGAIAIVFALFRSRKHASSVLRRLQFPARSAALLPVLLLLLVGGLFVERYGINLARYGTPIPDCSQVLSVEQCQRYSPWARDHLYSNTLPEPTTQGIAVYPFVWVHRMVFETMFTISSRFYPDGITVEYWPWPPLTVANYTAWTIVVVGSVLMLRHARRLWRMTYLRYLLLIIGFYTLVLFIKNFSMYLHTGEAVAIHGRYLIPLYPVLYLALALGFGWALDRFVNRQQFKTWLVVATTVLLLQGGGIVVWIVRSDPAWYWPQSAAAAQANRTAKEVLRYTTVRDITLWRGPWYPPAR